MKIRPLALIFLGMVIGNCVSAFTLAVTGKPLTITGLLTVASVNLLLFAAVQLLDE